MKLSIKSTPCKMPSQFDHRKGRIYYNTAYQNLIATVGETPLEKILRRNGMNISHLERGDLINEMMELPRRILPLLIGIHPLIDTIIEKRLNPINQALCLKEN